MASAAIITKEAATSQSLTHAELLVRWKWNLSQEKLNSKESTETIGEQINTNEFCRI